MIGTVLVASTPAEALQCVPFAREISGISIRGDAWTWWSAAAGQYDRGHAPKVGAVVVFKKFAAMRYGHVAVVARVVNSREVMVDHANWAPHRGRGRGQVSKMVAVTDVSPGNDWTEVRVWNASTRDLGTRTYPTYGFIYPDSPRGFVQQAVASASSEAVVSAVVRRRSSPSGDAVLATADRQIAAALAEDCAPAPAVTGPAVEAKAVEAAASLPAEAKVTMVAVNEVKAAPMPVQTASIAGGSAGDGVWEGDIAAAKRVGAGRY
ncbi:CHAP domain-containing protein [Telmatospirillum siberiense]|nr:CHAP domain-containing protein [Telmatospirillum siberiense]